VKASIALFWGNEGGCEVGEDVHPFAILVVTKQPSTGLVHAERAKNSALTSQLFVSVLDDSVGMKVRSVEYRCPAI
jgi:hypothetical protein